MPLSAVDCIQPAIQRTRDQLFRPFRFGQWSRLALVGLLAGELRSTSCNFNGFNFPINSPQHRGNEFLETSAASPFPHIDPSHIAQFAALFVIAFAALFVMMVVFMYISSVFRFILFDSVLKKQCSISAGWSQWHRTGRKYFLWQVVFIIAELLFMGVLIGGPLAIAAALGWFHDADQHMLRTVLGVFFLICLFLVFILLAVIVQVLGKDFLVPIMALDGVDFADGWGKLLPMIRREAGKYAVYLVLKAVLSIAAGIVIGILTLIPIFALVVPAVLAVFAGYKAGLGWNVTTVSLAIIGGTVLLGVLFYLISLVSVPAFVFFPAYSMYFFSSRYPRLDALLNPPPPALPPEVASPPPESPPPQSPAPDVPPLPPSPEPIG